MQTTIRNKLSESEKIFCEYFAQCGNAISAADFAGFQNPKRDGPLLLCRTDIRKKINALCETILKSSQARACLGYQRIAFGNVSDAIKLLYLGDLSDIDLEGLDLMNVAEIKKLKDGAMEIKFFDRLKALDKLLEFENESSKKSSSLLDAIKNGARALEKADDYGND